jgi:hypothetical protein
MAGKQSRDWDSSCSGSYTEAHSSNGFGHGQDDGAATADPDCSRRAQRTKLVPEDKLLSVYWDMTSHKVVPIPALSLFFNSLNIVDFDLAPKTRTPSVLFHLHAVRSLCTTISESCNYEHFSVIIVM